MLPTFSMKPGQFVPNWKLIVTPETQPRPKDSAKIFTQNRYASMKASSPVRLYWSLKYKSSQPSAIVIVGNRMWNEMSAEN